MSWKFTPRPFVETDEALKNPVRYSVLWMIFRNVVMKEPDMSRRKLLDDMSVTFADAGHESYRFRDGSVYPLPDIDDVFGESEMRWLSYFLEADDSGQHPRRMSRKPERLRLLNLYIKLKHRRFKWHIERGLGIDALGFDGPPFPGSGRKRR